MRKTVPEVLRKDRGQRPALLVTNTLLSAGGQDGKILPTHETNQIVGFFLSCPLTRPKKNRRYYMMAPTYEFYYGVLKAIFYQ